MRHLIAIVLLCAMTGCVRPAPVPSGPEPAPDPIVSPEQPTGLTKAVFVVLAEDIEAGRLTESDHLVSLVQQLDQRGSIDNASLERFHKAFADLAAKNRPLTAADAAKLRSF